VTIRDDHACGHRVNGNQVTIKRSVVRSAQRQPITGITGPVVCVGYEVGRIDQLSSADLTQSASTSVALDHLHFEALLVWSSARAAKASVA
jgi:hypothetical protein